MYPSAVISQVRKMDSKRLNDECCFSCQKDFDGTRSAIKMDENAEAIKRILDVKFSAELYVGTMNLCMTCHAEFKEAKEEFLKFKTIEASFRAKREKWAFTIVQSIIDDDYLGTSIDNHFLNLRAKIFGQWKDAFKKRPLVKTPNTPAIGITLRPSDGIPGNVRPIISPVVKSVKSLQVVPTITSPEKVTSTMHVEPLNRSKPIIFIRKDPVTGKTFRVKTNGINGVPGTNTSNIRYRVSTAELAKAGITNFKCGVIQEARPILTPSTISKPLKIAPMPIPSRPIVRTNNPGKVTVASPPKKRVNSSAVAKRASLQMAKEKSPDICQSFTSDKKAVKRKSDSPLPSPSVQIQSISNRSKRIIKKPQDTSCLYGTEYDKSMKYSAILNSKRRAKAIPQRNSLSIPQSVGETGGDFYRYDAYDKYEQMEGSTLEEFEAEENQDQSGEIENDSRDDDLTDTMDGDDEHDGTDTMVGNDGTGRE